MLSHDYRGWLFVVLAVVFGAVAVGLLVETDGFTNLWPTVLCAITSVLFSLFLSKAMLTIPMSIAYASYAALAIAITTIVGLVAYRERLKRWTVAGLALIAIGIVILHTRGSLQVGLRRQK